MRYKTAVFQGRFQPVHFAHIKIIKEALQIAETVIISVGTAKRARTIKNPWTAEERIALIKDALKEELGLPQSGWEDYPNIVDRIKFITIRDHKYNDTKWAAELYSKAVNAGATQDKDTVLVGCFKDSSSYYLKMFPQWDFHEVERIYSHSNHLLSATDIRDELFIQGKVTNHTGHLAKDTIKQLNAWASLGENYPRLKDEFEHVRRYKDAWAMAPFPPVFLTTDAVVIKSGHILMVKRGFNPGKGLWALPGGFLDQKEKIENGMLRELKEETRIKVDKAILQRSIIESKVFDHPERSLRCRTITHAYLIDLGEGPLPYVKGSDDAVGAHWIPLADLQSIEDELFEDHMDIITYLTSRF